MTPGFVPPHLRPWKTENRCGNCQALGARRLVDVAASAPEPEAPELVEVQEGMRAHEAAARQPRSAWLCVDCFTRIIGPLQ